jgi:hypothetical protein
MFEIINSVVKELTLLRNIRTQDTAMMAARFAPAFSPQRAEFSHLSRVDTVHNVSEEDEEDEEDEDEEDEEEEEEEEEEDEEEEITLQNNDVEELVESLITEIDPETVKFVNVDISNQYDAIEPMEADLDLDIEQEEEERGVELSPTEEIQVEKVDDEVGEEGVEQAETPAATSMDVYRKMTLPALKTLVVTKGLSSDPSKLKKNELLKLLESME